MRIRKLDIEGFGPFRDRQVLDFVAAASGGILLISGRTGAGKSSLLDAVSFALYGAVPRYDGMVSRVRSDHSAPAKPTLVRLEFEVAGERYLIERSPEYTRPAKRGGGTTTQKTEARLWRWDDAASDWLGLASRPVDVAAELSPVLRLNHDQFLQVVMLSQGGFQRFLRAADDERQATLRTLFQTGRYADIEAELIERRKTLDGAAKESEARIDALIGGLEAALARDAADSGSAESPVGLAGSRENSEGSTVQQRRERVGHAIEALAQRAASLGSQSAQDREAQRTASADLDRARALRARQERLARAEEKRAALAARAEEVRSARAEVEAAERAALVAAELRKLDGARAAEGAATALWAETWGRLKETNEEFSKASSATSNDADPSVRSDLPPQRSSRLSGDEPWAETREALANDQDQVARLLGSLTDARDDEARHTGLLAELTGAREELGAVAADHAKEQVALAALPARIAELRTERAQAAVAAAGLDRCVADLERASTKRTAAAAVTVLEPRLETAQTRSADCAIDVATAAAAVSDLLSRRIAGMAGELADALVEGEPCAVCGSATHPSPASHADPVTPEAVEEAEGRRAAAQARLDAAREAERAIEAELSAERATSEGVTPAEAAAAVSVATEALEVARTAGKRASEIDAELLLAEEETAKRAARVADLGARVASLTSSIQAREAQAVELAEELGSARGGYASIDARTEHLEMLARALAECARSGAERAAAQAATAGAHERAADALLEQGFTTHGFDHSDLAAGIVAVEAAVREAADIEVLRRTVREYDDETQRNAGELAAADLQHLDTRPLDLDGLTATAAAAEARAEASLSSFAAAGRIAAEHEATLQSVDRELAGFAVAGEELLRLRRLADTVQGKDPNTKRMRLEVFVLAARLEAIVAAANRRLATMVGGRYRLAHDDGPRARGRQSGLGLAVIDEYTGRARTTDSLSGGESFLASLALALGLADVVTAESGGLELDTLFVDEGFGSLDPDALDQALATLDGLREGGRTVALISHVSELKERLAGGLEVIADGQGVSRLRGDGVLPPDSPTPHDSLAPHD